MALFKILKIKLIAFSFLILHAQSNLLSPLNPNITNEPPNPYILEKDGKYHLQNNKELLDSFVEQVKIQSIEKNYPTYRGRAVIEHSVYKNLDSTQKQKLIGSLVLSRFYIAKFIKYSHLGGVGIAGSFVKDDEENIMYFSFDGRYLSDLQAFGLGSQIYAYCVLPRFDKCIMLGIGEQWK